MTDRIFAGVNGSTADLAPTGEVFGFEITVGDTFGREHFDCTVGSEESGRRLHGPAFTPGGV